MFNYVINVAYGPGYHYTQLSVNPAPYPLPDFCYAPIVFRAKGKA